MSQLTVTFEVPGTEDLCWTQDGIQCFHDAILAQARVQVTFNLIKAIGEDNEVMQAHYRRQLAVINSVSVNSTAL
jgi:hypothetical protein